MATTTTTTSSSALGAGAGAGAAVATAAAVVPGCPVTLSTEPGYALVIAYYDDPIRNTRTFFMGKESYYVDQYVKNSSGNPVINAATGKQQTIRFRPLNPTAATPTLATNDDRLKAARENANYNPLKNHIVLRKSRSGRNVYTIQRLSAKYEDHKWSFPKGEGKTVAEDSKTIAIREFEEETGYRLPDQNKLLFKKCVVEFQRVCVVFFYKLSEAEHTALVTAFTEQKKKKTSELFNIEMVAEADVSKRRKNRFSELAFEHFANYEAAAIDQTNIPRGGPIDPSAATVPPAVVPSAPVVAPVSATSVAKYVVPQKRRKSGGSRRRRQILRKTRRHHKNNRK
jgi:ADP-ribose pyrophosphatase YjhB (NUDIX family)